MSRVRIAVAAGLLVAAVAVWLWSIHESVAPVPQTHAAVAAPPSRVETRAVEIAATAVETAATTTDYAARFRDADDLLAFIGSIRAAANAGDGAAQYYLYRAIRRCTREYDVYFGRDERERTLDQALIHAEKNPALDQQTVRELFQKCQAFTQRNPKETNEQSKWLARAAESRFPLALSAVAREKSPELFRKHSAEELAEIKSTIRELALGALRSKDPQVLADLAEIAPFFTDNPGAEADDVNAVWIIAACQRGASCGNESEGFRFLCRMDPACQPYETVTDLLRRARGATYDALEARARALNEQIDQGRFDELGFEPMPPG